MRQAEAQKFHEILSECLGWARVRQFESEKDQTEFVWYRYFVFYVY